MDYSIDDDDLPPEFDRELLRRHLSMLETEFGCAGEITMDGDLEFRHPDFEVGPVVLTLRHESPEYFGLHAVIAVMDKPRGVLLEALNLANRELFGSGELAWLAMYGEGNASASVSAVVGEPKIVPTSELLRVVARRGVASLRVACT